MFAQFWLPLLLLLPLLLFQLLINTINADCRRNVDNCIDAAAAVAVIDFVVIAVVAALVVVVATIVVFVFDVAAGDKFYSALNA